MFKKLKQNLMYALSLILVSGSLMGSVSGQIEPTLEEEIFPFEKGASNFESVELEYTEDLYEVREDGVYDDRGEQVEFIPSAAADEEAELEAQRSFLLGSQDAFDDYLQSIIANFGGKREFTQKRLESIESDLKIEGELFESVSKEVADLEVKLEPIHKEIETLTKQVDLINGQLIQTKEAIKSAEWQIAEKQFQINDLMQDLKKSEVELELQRGIVMDYILLVYSEEEQFFDLFEKGASSVKLLLSDNSFSENLLGVQYASILEKTGRAVFHDLHRQKLALEQKQKNLVRQQLELEGLYRKLNTQKRVEQEARNTKKTLLAMTRGEELEYEKLLDESIQQRLESAIAIKNMQDNIAFIEDKLLKLDDSIEEAASLSENSNRFAQVQELEAEVIDLQYDIEDGLRDDLVPTYQPFAWPVPPSKVTAYFRDPTYPKRWGTHNAVDLRASQYTEILAPANAYVFQAKDNGLGYSYIILAHKNQLMTVYGHVSEIHVRPGTVVKQGDVIGLTGGTPGTKGAGWQTTGPHLHFEVYHKGQPVNPLDFLPVMDLPIEYIPDEYLTPRQLQLKLSVQ